VPITELPSDAGCRLPTGLSEVDLVLGGGLVPGSCLLLAGDPGVGKSTLLLSVASALTQHGGQRVLYVTGEESAAQIRLRAGRIAALHPELLVLAETNVLAAVAAARATKPAVMIVDSVQTLYHPDISSPPGSVSQVRECAALLVDVAKGLPAAVWIVGHVTKDGSVAGPRLLEHMVDVVLQFEGERTYPYRILRGLKNRFGATDEIGIFEMADAGLREVSNPSHVFLSDHAGDASMLAVPGTAVTAALEGRRVICAEVQALVVSSPWGAPRRTAMGVDGNRLALIIAVLERRAGIRLVDRDVYVKVAGGVKLVEPGVDLAVAVAVASAGLDRAVRPGLVFAGEIGLRGEVRGVTRQDQRMREAVKLGFDSLVTRGTGKQGNLTGVSALGDALALSLQPPRRAGGSQGAPEPHG
jgi:DNA repair protein RadA/Sms